MRRSAVLCFFMSVWVALPEDGSAAEAPVWPPPPADARIYFLDAFSSGEEFGIEERNPLKAIWGLLVGEDDQAIARPHGIAVTKAGTSIYVADPGLGAVHVFDRQGARYYRLTEAGAQKLISPIGVAVDDLGRLYVSDSVHDRVFLYDNKLEHVSAIGKLESLKRPTGIAATRGRLYVVDTGAHRVVVYADQGRFLFTFGERGTGNGQFNYPTSIAVSSLGRLYVNDSMNFRVQVFDLAGEFLSQIGSPGDSSGHFHRSKDLGLDSDGNLYVVDALFDTVQIFDPSGQFLLNFGAAGEGQGEFWLPTGIAVDEHDRIYVADSYNSRIQVFQYVKQGVDSE